MRYTRLKNKTFLLIFCLIILNGFIVYTKTLYASSSSNSISEKPGYVDIVQVLEYFNLDYEFDEWTGILILKKGVQVLKLQTGSKVFFYRNRTYFSTLPSYTEAGRIYVSSDLVDFISKRIARKRVKWMAENKNFVVTGRMAREGRQMVSRKETGFGVSKRTIDVIIIDPGHGGKDPGGIGYNGIKEKDIVLDISKILHRELKRNFNKKVVMTRKDDTFVSLEERSKIANENNDRGNSIFISIHANVALDRSSKGFESYYLSLHPFGENARNVAEIENAVINYENKPYADYLEEVLNRVVDVEYRKESMRLASYINQGITRMVDKVTLNRGVKGAFFYVLKESKMVAVLIEVGFITNREEAELLQNKEYQTKLSKGIASGIMDFVGEFEKTNGFTEGY